MEFQNHDLTNTINQLKEWEKGIDTDIIPAMNRGISQGGYHSTIRLIFCFIDVLGAMYSNDSKASSAIDFIKVYFGKINIRYAEIAGILYATFRHGSIHTYYSKRFLINGIPYRWLICKDTDLPDPTNKSVVLWKKEEDGDGQLYTHLITQSQNPSHQYFNDNPKTMMLPISLEKFVEDLKLATSNYVIDLEKEQELQKKAIKMFEKMRTYTEFRIENGVVMEIHPLMNKEGRKKRPEISFRELSNI
jgi:hypothetical protein